MGSGAGRGSLAAPNNSWNVGADGTELRGWAERDVDLKCAAEQVNAVDGAAATQVQVRKCGVVGVQAGGPVGHDVRQIRARCDGHREVDVRPLVAGAGSRRSGQCGGGDAIVRARIGHELIPEPVTIRRSEHAARLIRRGSDRLTQQRVRLGGSRADVHAGDPSSYP